jgi:phosphatidylglycerol:prolipoprotein diacylglycerol transferase
LPVTCGIAVGRIGCFLAGLKDETYGVVTQLPWGVDLGDGLSRHPVALYESLSLAIFAMAIALWRRNRMTTYREFAFYIFIVFYAAQRFAWEFLKPYKTVVGPLNTFHLVCLAMIAYALTMMWRVHAHDRRRSTD